jgi:4-hydroxy-tetrahydrodipicolinate synthase
VRSVIQKFPLVAALKEVVAQANGEPGWRRQRPPLESLSKQDAAALVEQLAATGFTLDRAA